MWSEWWDALCNPQTGRMISLTEHKKSVVFFRRLTTKAFDRGMGVWCWNGSWVLLNLVILLVWVCGVSHCPAVVFEVWILPVKPCFHFLTQSRGSLGFYDLLWLCAAAQVWISRRGEGKEKGWLILTHPCGIHNNGQWLCSDQCSTACLSVGLWIWFESIKLHANVARRGDERKRIQAIQS